MPPSVPTFELWVSQEEKRQRIEQERSMRLFVHFPPPKITTKKVY